MSAFNNHSTNIYQNQYENIHTSKPFGFLPHLHLIVEGIPRSVKIPQIYAYFEAFSKVIKAEFLLTNSRFGKVASVTLLHSESLTHVLSFREHEIDGSLLTLTRKHANIENLTNFKVFIKKLPKKSTKADLNTFFSAFGDIENIEIPYSKAEITSRGYAIVELSRYSDYLNILNIYPMLYKNKQIEVTTLNKEVLPVK